MTESAEADLGLFAGIENAEIDAEEELVPRQKKAYKLAIARPQTKKEAIANGEGLFGDIDIFNTVPLRELYPPIEEVRELPRNGLKVIGTFDGCGGSMTGFEWSGWHSLASVEFVKAARETLAANYPSLMIEPEAVFDAAKTVAQELGYPIRQYGSGSGDSEPALWYYKPVKVTGKRIPESVNWEETILSIRGDAANEFRTRVNRVVYGQLESVPADVRPMVIWGDDIRGLDPYVLMEYLGLERGELDGLEGSPPCKSFSTSGLRELGWGRILKYSDERKQRTDDLFLEFLRLLTAFLPRSFVAENVAGMGMGTAETEKMQPLLRAFESLGYNVEAKVINAKDYLVPQSRPRMLFIGIRNDQVDNRTGRVALPQWPQIQAGGYSVQDALDAAKDENTAENLAYSWLGSKDDLATALGYDSADEVPAKLTKDWRQTIPRSKLTDAGDLEHALNVAASSVAKDEDETVLGEYQDGADASKQSDDLVPWPSDMPRYETGLIWYALPEGGAPMNKAYQLMRCASTLPAPTITATGAGNQPAAGACHPHEPRKFTIPEYRYLFSFPQGYRFTGTINQQGERMGRSVPPYLMKQIADQVANVLLNSTSRED